MSAAATFFVQFPHPGAEHNPRSDEMPWNTAGHRRKFLVSPGRYLNGNGCVEESDLSFWGEWEAPSRVKRRWPKSGHMPRALHRPYWAEPTTNASRQNTDPWVFGKRMMYSNCKQITNLGRPSSMQNLARGSVICFGSTINQEFCVDTVFVVSCRETWTPIKVQDLDVDDAFLTCTARAIATLTKPVAHASFTLYRGATVDDPVEGMFSFVPARLADREDTRFSRPPISLEFINPANRQSTWGSKRSLSITSVRGAWKAVRDQVLDAGHLLGVWLQTPRREEEGADIPNGVSGCQRC